MDNQTINELIYATDLDERQALIQQIDLTYDNYFYYSQLINQNNENQNNHKSISQRFSRHL